MDNYQYNPEVQTDKKEDLREENKLGTASLIFGILAIPASITIWFGVIFAVAAIVLGIISRLNKGTFKGGAVAGFTLGIIFLIISLMMFAFYLKMISSPEFMELISQYMNR